MQGPTVRSTRSVIINKITLSSVFFSILISSSIPKIRIPFMIQLGNYLDSAGKNMLQLH